ncbi:MAG: dihydroorotase, partial [Eubacteriales bacterium]|nr:dihydroorotase [Eubacteriales bacterium]
MIKKKLSHLKAANFVLRNVRVVDPYSGKDELGDLAIKEGIVIAADEADTLPEIDARRLIAVPGLTDAHVHLREPGQEYKEDLVSGTRAAAHGGIVQLACMPNTQPVVDNPALISYLIDRAETAGYCEVLPIGAVSKGLAGVELAEIGLMRDAGAVAFSDDGRAIERAEMMRKAMIYAQAFGCTLHSHCEDSSLAEGGSMNESWVSTEMGLFGIPTLAEDVMIARDLLISEYYDCPIHICHVSTATGISMIRDAKARGVQVTAETCPHYFTFTDASVRGFRSNFKMNPPLRSEKDRLAVLEGICDGTIDVIVSDHAPHHRDEKEVEFALALNGVIGLETLWPVVYKELVLSRRLNLMEALNLLCVNPRRLLHQDDIPIMEGEKANLMLFAEHEVFVYDK